MKKIFINNKKYKILDLLHISFRVSPMGTTIMMVSRVLDALMPSFTVLVTADFLDKAIAIIQKQILYKQIFLPLILYMLIILYSKVNRAFVSNFIRARLEMKVRRCYVSELIEKCAKLDYRYIENNDSWDLINRTCKDAQENIMNGLNNILNIMSITIQVGSLLLILMLNVWWVGLIILAIAIPLLRLALKSGKDIYDSVRKTQYYTRRADYYHTILSSRENIEERTMFGYTNKVNKLWYDRFEEARKIKMKVQLKNFIRLKSSSLITVLISISMIGIFLIPLEKNMITIGMFMGLTTATLDLVQMMSWQLAYVVRSLAQSSEYLKDLTKLMALSEREGAIDLPEIHKGFTFESIEFVNVSYKYPETEKYVLYHFNLKILKNKHYALVGANGAGKTTITKLLTGMYDTYTGTILINGKDLKNYKLSEIKGIFTVIFQDFAKYYVSFKDNILLGDTVNMDKDLNKDNQKTIIDIIESIGLTECVNKLPNNIESYLGKIINGGVDLSGGEWQRLAVARALYNPAQVRILDEPTAALDPLAESRMYQMFGEISRGETTIFITHRLGAAKLADEIIVIENGQVVEQGNHDKLMSLGGIYTNMFESQRSWYQNEKYN